MFEVFGAIFAPGWIRLRGCCFAHRGWVKGLVWGFDETRVSRKLYAISRCFLRPIFEVFDTIFTLENKAKLNRENAARTAVKFERENADRVTPNR
jgi:hypothetical protein